MFREKSDWLRIRPARLIKSLGGLMIGVAATATLQLPVWADSKPEAAEATLQKKEVVAGLLGPWQSLKQLLIEYDATPRIKTDGYVPVHRIMAVSKPDQLYHLTAHETPNQPWQVDPYAQEFVLSGGVAFHRWPFNRSHSETKKKTGDELGGTIWNDVLFMLMPAWPLSEYKAAVDVESKMPVLPFMALESDDYQLLKDLEVSGQQLCYVFDKPGLDRIWVSSDRPFCMMRRDIRSRSGKLLQRILSEEIEEIARGLWFPTRIRVQFFSPTDEQVVDRETEMVVSRVVVNEAVPASIFQPAQPKGTIRHEPGGGFTQISGGGEELLSEMAGFMVKHGNLPTHSHSGQRSATWVAFGAVSGMCVGFMCIPRRRRGP